jgi:SnoaL-like polyketide cyclase/Glyoxalase-like domain
MAPGSTDNAGRGALTLEFEVDDVDGWFDRVRAAGAPVVKPPTTQAWGRRSVWLRDPDGNIVNLYEPVPLPLDPSTVVREYFRRLFGERDLTACDELLAPDFVDHDAPEGSPPGPQATRAYLASMFEEYSELAFAIDGLITSDRFVALTATWSGMPLSSGIPWYQTGLVLMYVDGSGRIRERWSTYQDAGMAPPPG